MKPSGISNFGNLSPDRQDPVLNPFGNPENQKVSETRIGHFMKQFFRPRVLQLKGSAFKHSGT